MRHRKHLHLLALLLVLIMTAEAAAAYALSCQGTVSCCCSAVPADMDMAAGTAPDCCGSGASQPCSLESAPAANPPYLSAPIVDGIDVHAATAGRAGSPDLKTAAGRGDWRAAGPLDRSRPPIYLRIQSFLC